MYLPVQLLYTNKTTLKKEIEKPLEDGKNVVPGLGGLTLFK
jgi:hypothetical protein